MRMKWTRKLIDWTWVMQDLCKGDPVQYRELRRLVKNARREIEVWEAVKKPGILKRLIGIFI